MRACFHLAIALMALSCATHAPTRGAGPKSEVVVFGGPPLAPQHRNPTVLYQLDPGAEQFYVWVPKSYTGQVPWGLLVEIEPQFAGDPGLPREDWVEVLEAKRLLWITALKTTNDQPVERRYGKGVLAALEMMKHYNVDPRRVYATGLSGGARVAGGLAFLQPDVFKGAIQHCGADWYQPVPRKVATVESLSDGYGTLLDASEDDRAKARANRFALITGPDDFRHGNILDLFHGGFEKEGFQARLFDVPGMGHEYSDGRTLAAAIDFVDAAPK